MSPYINSGQSLATYSESERNIVTLKPHTFSPGLGSSTRATTAAGKVCSMHSSSRHPMYTHTYTHAHAYRLAACTRPPAILRRTSVEHINALNASTSMQTHQPQCRCIHDTLAVTHAYARCRRRRIMHVNLNATPTKPQCANRGASRMQPDSGGASNKRPRISTATPPLPAVLPAKISPRPSRATPHPTNTLEGGSTCIHTHACC